MLRSRRYAISGSNTLSCSCPASAAIVTVTSPPMTSKHTWFTTSGMTGFTLPGMIDEPGCIAGRVDLTEAGARAGAEQPEVVADLRQLHRAALEHAGQLDERAGVRRRLDEIGRGDQRQPREPGEVGAYMFGVPRRSVDAGADRGRAHVDLPNERLRFAEPVDVLEHRVAEGGEFLAERHRHRVLKLRPPHFEVRDEFLPFVEECGGERGHRGSQALDAHVQGDLHRRGIHVIRRLAEIDMIVRVDGLVVAARAAGQPSARFAMTSFAFMLVDVPAPP